MSSNKKVAIIGSGLIGRGWSIIFSSFSYRVQLYDINQECLDKTPELIREELTYLCNNNLARGNLTLDERMALISTTNSLEECVKDAVHIQECVFENLALKQDIFEQIDRVLGENSTAAICSSTSVHLPSMLFAKVTRHLDQCLVAHPINPPLHVRLVELVPHSETRDDIMKQARDIMKEVGQKPVNLRKEISGFALNRLQFAVFQEAYRLVHDGVMTPDDADTVVSDGLGPRYAFMGPWMTAHLNANGLADYIDRYGDGIYNVSKDCQPLLRIEGEAAQMIADSMNHEVPLDKLVEKRTWRDKCLIELAKIKDRLGKGV